MTCIPISNGILCVNPPINYGRLHLGKKYVWVDFHPYCGPIFSWDKDGQKEYIPKDEGDPIWPLFSAWYDKRNKKLEKQDAKR